MANFNLPFGIRVSNDDPVDGDRYLRASEAEMFALVTNGRAKEGQQCYRTDESTLYILKGTTNNDWVVEVSSYDDTAIQAEVDLNTAKISYTDATDVGLNTAHRSITTGNPHSVTKTEIGLSNVPNIDTTNASNITSGTLPSSVIPPVALTSVQVAISQVAMLALTTEEGDVVVRSDENKSYIRNDGITGTMTDFTELQTPTDSVLSVNGETGTVVLTTTNVAEGTNEYYTEAKVSANTSVAANTAKTGITAQQATDITTNTAKVGITTQQSNDIIANNAKVTNVNTDLSLGPVSATAMDVNSSDGNNVTLTEATPTFAGLLNATDKGKLNNTSGTNTGDQDISGIATNASDITTLQGDSHTHNNKTQLDTIDAADITNLSNLSGINTGDQIIPTSGVDFDPVGTDNSDNNAVNTLYSGLQSEVDLNTAKVTNVDHPLVETAVPVGAVFTDTDTVYDDTAIQSEVDLNTAKVSNVDHPLVETAVPSGAVFTDTIYDDSAVLKDSDALSVVTGVNKLMTQSDVAGLGGGDMLAATYDPIINANTAKVTNVDHPLVETAVPVGALFTDTDTVYDDTAIQAEVDLNTAKVGITTAQSNEIAANTLKETNIAHPLVETAVPIGAVFTDTVYDDTAIQAEVDLNTAKISFDSTSSTRLANTSGTNTGDQTLPISGVDFDPVGTDNSDNNAVNSLYSGLQAEVDLNTAKVSNVDHPLVETAVPIGAVFTDTVYDSTAVDAHIANVTTNPHSVDKADVGLSNVDNTSDANKPVSTATQTELDLKASNVDLNAHSGNTSNVHQVSLEQARTQSNVLSGDINFNNNSIDNLTDLNFTDGGPINWNTKYHTIDVPTGDGSIVKVGMDTLFDIHNATGDILLKGTVVYPNGTSTLGISNVSKAIADTHVTISSQLGVIAYDVLPGADGHVMVQGVLDPIDTSLLSEGPVYLSSTVAGELTSVKPDFTDYHVLLGVVDSSAVSGVITIDIAFNLQNTLTNFWNGVFRESFNFLITSNGTTITGTLTPASGNTDMTMLFSDGFSLLDTSPSATVVLTPGTDTVPLLNYIYIPRATKVLTVSTVGFPAEEHIKIGTSFLQTAATTLSFKALKNHNFNDHVQGSDGQGHLSHITERLRTFPATHESGTEASISGLPTNAYVTVTSGVIYQLHTQIFEASVMPTDNIHIVNHFTTPYLRTTDLLTQLNDANGDSFNNTSFSLVVWGVANKSGEGSHVMCNLPIGSYSKNTPDLAVADSLGYSVYTIPKDFRGAAFLIARFTFVNNNGTWSIFDTQDLRGKLANTSAGGVVGGGAGVTTVLGLTDTPSTFIGNSLDLVRVNVGETALEFTPDNTLKTTDALSTVTAINKLMTQDDIAGLGDGDMSKATYDTNSNNIVDNAELVNGLTVLTAVPSGALFTDTIYNDTAIQAEVDLNTAKTGITTTQASDIITNNAKVGITTQQASDITTNNAKIGVTTELKPADIDTLAEVNAIITDATLIDTGDSRLSDARTPTAHNHTASEVTDFDTEVSNNASVTANTAKVSFVDAPSNGSEYVRKDAAWAVSTGTINNYTSIAAPQLFNPSAGEVTANTGDYTLANTNSVAFVSINGQVVDDSEYSLAGSTLTVTPDNGFSSTADELLVFQHTFTVAGTDVQAAVALNTAKVSFVDAPSDGSEYVRKDAAWSVASGGGGVTIYETYVDGYIDPNFDYYMGILVSGPGNEYGRANTLGAISSMSDLAFELCRPNLQVYQNQTLNSITIYTGQNGNNLTAVAVVVVKINADGTLSKRVTLAEVVRTYIENDQYTITTFNDTALLDGEAVYVFPKVSTGTNVHFSTTINTTLL